MRTQLIALLAALGRPLANATTVTDDQLAAAINEAVPVATAAVSAVNELATTKTSLTSAQNEVATLKSKLTEATTSAANERTARTELVLTRAVNEGRITQAQRAEWLGKFNAQGADFAAVEAELGKVQKAVNTTNKVAGIGGRKAESEVDTSKISAINEAVAAKTKAGLSHHDAFLAVKKEKPELFAATNAS